MTDIWIDNSKYCDIVYYEFRDNVLFMQIGDGTFLMVSCEDFIFHEDR